jgi:predicted nucleic acid-binding protein
MKYALDTNIISFYMHGNPCVKNKFHAAVENNDLIAIPSLVHYEIKRGLLCKPYPKYEIYYNILITRCPVIQMSEDVIETGAKIYADLFRAKRTVADVDLLIAAFCICGEYTLVTNNSKHFAVTNKLMIEDWTL